MADHSKQRLNVDQLCGMHHLANVCKSCKSFLLTRRHKNNNNNSSPNKIEAPKDLNSIDQKNLKDNNNKSQHKETINTDVPNHIENNDNHSKTAPSSPQGHSISIPSRFSSHSQPLRTSSNHVLRTPSRLSKSASQKSQSGASRTTTPTASSLLKSMSRKSNNVEAGPPGSAFSRSSSIMYSNSNGMIKPPAVQQTLECTLEEICFGCIRKIKITRDVVTNYGQIVQEDEVLTIKVKPGWKTGTTITFDGMGNETPGGQTSDMTFVIAEKQHVLFKRDGDDLVLTINVPLVTALVDSTPLIPLLGGETMKLEMGNSTICPGDQHIVAGQGMPKSKEHGERGKLIVNFLVEFPKELSDEQRAGVFDILQDCC